MKVEHLTEIVAPLIDWFEKNARQMPWRQRNTPNPYHIWVSEIMLQQTRVDAVIPYYLRFLEELPSVEALAAAPEEQLLKLWQGLGYYNRVRNMQKAARIIVEELGGKIPSSYEQLLKLPGIGAYTAGAVSSIAFGQPAPAVDGNVLRVIMRVTACKEDIGDERVKEKVRGVLKEIYPAGKAGMFTESLMELGALICLPNGAPKCGECPLEKCCLAHSLGIEQSLPVKQPKKVRKIEKKTVYLIFCGSRVAVLKRPPKGLLAGLWEFPNAEGRQTLKQAARQMEAWGLQPEEIKKGIAAKHIFSHIEWQMSGISAKCPRENHLFEWVTAERLQKEYAVPSAFEAYLKEAYRTKEDQQYKRKFDAEQEG